MAFWEKLLTIANVFIYKQSGGRVGNRMGRQSVLVLNTLGRKTGKPHSTTVSYYRDGENYLVVASNWGKENQPGWYYNLLHQRQATIQVGGEIIHIEAREIQGDEYQRVWALITPQNGQYAKYQAAMKRRIPILILTPLPSST